ncbi:MAG: Gfo/Idh/MocA family oxidoreductase [Acidimicrobiales bacterium]
MSDRKSDWRPAGGRVVLVGLGNISSAHLSALEAIRSVKSVVGVDPSPRSAATFRGAPLLVHRELRDALSDPADLVVVATPTGSHAAVVDAVRACDAVVSILVEKPAAQNRAAAQRMLAAGSGVRAILHSGFAPEVLWAARFYGTERGRLGDVVSFAAWFGSPYANEQDRRAASLVDSWLDSGINVLSVIGRFVVPAGVLSFRPLAGHVSTFEARLRLEPGDGTRVGSIVTTWQAAETTQSLRLRFADGSELLLDLMAGAATHLADGSVTEMFTRPEGGPHLAHQYANFYRDYFGSGEWQYPDGQVAALHALLFSATEGVG